jgi:hypothetical protein
LSGNRPLHEDRKTGIAVSMEYPHPLASVSELPKFRLRSILIKL